MTPFSQTRRVMPYEPRNEGDANHAMSECCTKVCNQGRSCPENNQPSDTSWGLSDWFLFIAFFCGLLMVCSSDARSWLLQIVQGVI